MFVEPRLAEIMIQSFCIKIDVLLNSSGTRPQSHTMMAHISQRQFSLFSDISDDETMVSKKRMGNLLTN